MEDRSTPENTIAALPAVLSAFNLWKLSQIEQMSILGLTSCAELYSLRKGDLVMARVDLVQRLSLILGIFKALGTMFPMDQAADGWMRAPNAAYPFEGRSAVQLASSGRIDDLWTIRRYLEAQVG